MSPTTKVLVATALALVVAGCVSRGCTNRVETPQNDPDDFTRCDPGITSEDGGTLWCWNPGMVWPSPPTNDIPSFAHLRDAGADAPAR